MGAVSDAAKQATADGAAAIRAGLAATDASPVA
jgi:hypothetical protein